jgi:hypothetical protein
MRIPVDEERIDAPCPMCARVEEEGRVQLVVSLQQTSGQVFATCSRGHGVIVDWERESA